MEVEHELCDESFNPTMQNTTVFGPNSSAVYVGVPILDYEVNYYSTD